MKDVTLRGIVMNHLYENRRDPYYNPIPNKFNGLISDDEVIRICEQLKQSNFVEAVIKSMMGGGKFMISATLTARGIDVVEGELVPDISIDLMANINVSGSSNTNVIVGNNNSQNIQNNISEILKAIESSNASPEEKAEAKGLLQKLVAHPLVSTIAGVVGTALLGG